MNLLESKNGRSFLATALYFSEGAPIGFIWWALPTLLRKENIPIEQITSLTALLVLPWVFKFLWAPLVDSLRNERFGFKSWIIGSQIMMGLALIPLAFINPANNFLQWGMFLFVHSVAAATQDVSIDALVINSVTSDQRGSINGYMQAGMLLGRSLFGGLSILVASLLGIEFVIFALIIAIWITTSLLFFVREPVWSLKKENKFKEFKSNIILSFKKRKTWLGLLFALTAAAAFEVAGALAGPFLLDRGASDSSIGIFFSIPVVIAMLIGGIAGGKISDKINRRKSVSIFLAGFVFAVMTLAIVDLTMLATDTSVYFIVLTSMYLFVGLFIASSYALFMDLTDPRIAGTQFSTYMSATNGCEAWSVWLAGRITSFSGYAVTLIIMGIISLLSLPVLKLIKNEN